MARLVVDLGGTNCRLALAKGGRPLTAVQSYQNAKFTGFSALLSHYLVETDRPVISEMVIAVAGPVTGPATAQKAELTNRGWQLSARDLSREWGAIPVQLLNDLSALGHSLADLKHSDLAVIHATPHPSAQQGPVVQKLVVGIGTGFNLSPVFADAQGSNCLKSEYGHVALPLDLHQALVAQLGAKAADFTTLECCFSGRGLAALYAAFAPDAAPRSGAQILAASRHNEVTEFIDFYARLLALLSRNLLKGFLPLGGLYFAGAVARNLLTGPGGSAFVTAYSQRDPKFPDLGAPVFCILEDAAALKGCAGFRFPAA